MNLQLPCIPTTLLTHTHHNAWRVPADKDEDEDICMWIESKRYTVNRNVTVWVIKKMADEDRCFLPLTRPIESNCFSYMWLVEVCFLLTYAWYYVVFVDICCIMSCLRASYVFFVNTFLICNKCVIFSCVYKAHRNNCVSRDKGFLLMLQATPTSCEWSQ